MRDALSILERCLQDGESNIDEDKIKDLVGIPKLTYIHAIVKSFIEYNVEEAIKSVDVVLNEGKDLSNLLWEIIKYVKDILVYKATGKLEIYNEAELAEIKELAEKISKERLLYIITDLSKLENDMKWSSQKSILFQVEIIKLCSEDIVEKPVETVKRSGQNNSKTGDSKRIEGKDSRPEVKKEEPKADFAQAISGYGEAKGWKNVLSELRQNGKIAVYSNLLKAKAIELNDMSIGISFPEGINPFKKSILENPENINELSRIVSMEYGKDMKVKIIESVDSLPKKEQKNENPLENMANELNIPLNVIE